MIAEIMDPFEGDALNRKIDYQIKKIDNGVARELYNNSGDTLIDMYRNMLLVAGLNDRVKSPYIEFTLNSPIGEDLPDEKFLEVAKEYMEKMGYGESCYTVIKNEDKDHLHVHILATTVDMNGLWICDSYSKVRSGSIMRELEVKHGLEILEPRKSANKKTLGESLYRRYFFDTALRKALRSHNSKVRVGDILKESTNFIGLGLDMDKPYTNMEWEIILGEDTYQKLLEVLSSSKFFNSLLKDELLVTMDRLSQGSLSVKEFRELLSKEGYYMRLVSNRGKSHYVYGIPDRGFYVKDTSLPERYRFGHLSFDGQHMSADEQKHYLYNQVFAILDTSSGYDDFKERLRKDNIGIVEHTNEKGIYGISFAVLNVNEPLLFKASDISRRLTYHNIQNYLSGHGETGKTEMTVDPVLTYYKDNQAGWDKEINYMRPTKMAILGYISFGNGNQEEEDEPDGAKKKKKKKKRNYENEL